MDIRLRHFNLLVKNKELLLKAKIPALFFYAAAGVERGSNAWGKHLRFVCWCFCYALWPTRNTNKGILSILHYALCVLHYWYTLTQSTIICTGN